MESSRARADNAYRGVSVAQRRSAHGNGHGKARAMSVHQAAPGRASNRACRALNIVVAGALLVVSLPLMVLIALLVWATSPGPVIYVQTRVGLNRRNGGRATSQCRRNQDYGGRPFRLFKFRTMYVSDSDEDSQVWASPDDPRVTPVGRVLRKYRLDELPQLINVLLGDMNLVGPRPEQPKIFAQLRTHIEEYTERQRVLPGITGRAQVIQHYDRSVEDVRRKLELDLEYIERRSVAEDLRIMLKTVPVVIFKRGAW